MLSEQDLEEQLAGDGTAFPPVQGASESAKADRRLGDLADLLLAFSYLQGLLLLTPAVVLVLYGPWSLELQLAVLVAAGLIASTLFVTFKFLSELLRALAEQGLRMGRLQAGLDELRVLLRDGRGL